MSKRKATAAAKDELARPFFARFPREEPEADREGMVESASESAATMGEGYVSPEEERHRKLLRMLGHVKDAIASRLDELPTRRDLYRAMALAGYNSSTNPNISGEEPGLKAIWAKDDAEALLALGSEDETT
jgi:hypothetical protein